jgi:hypothetical protein
MNVSMPSFNLLVADIFPECTCEECVTARNERMLSDLDKKYGTVAEVQAKLGRMD